jgi:hypothetical protein
MTLDILLQAFALVFRFDVIAIIMGAAVFGMFVGAMPGLTATMATALLIPVTFFMDPVPALGAIVTATAMAIFAGDIPAAMLRMPGTPASAPTSSPRCSAASSVSASWCWPRRLSPNSPSPSPASSISGLPPSVSPARCSSPPTTR